MGKSVRKGWIWVAKEEGGIERKKQREEEGRKAWLNPGEEAEGKSLIGPRGRLGRKGVLSGCAEEEQL